MSDEQSSVLLLLDHYGVSHKAAGDGQELVHCLWCDTDDKLYLDPKQGLWMCHRCKETGNEWKLKARLEEKHEDVPKFSAASATPRQAYTPPSGTFKKTAHTPKLPDMEAAHAALLANDDVLNYLNDERGWPLETVKQMKLGLGKHFFAGPDTEYNCLIFPYYSKGKLAWAKWRTLPPDPKDFRAPGDMPAPLYNQDVITKGMDELLLLEGESDTLSALAAGITNVVGIPGADSKKLLWIEKLDSAAPKRMYLCFDNDKAGQKGAKALAVKIGIHKELYNIVLPPFEKADGTEGNDLGDWFLAGHTLEEFEQLKADAKKFDVDGITTIEEGIYELQNDVETKGSLKPDFPIGWESLIPIFSGFDRGELVSIIAKEKVGKTKFLLNWFDILAAQHGFNSLLDCYEVPGKKLTRQWVSYVTRTDDTPGVSPFATDPVFAKEVFARALEIKRQRTAHVQFGYTLGVTLDGMFEKWYQAIRRYGIDLIGLDNLQLIAKLTQRQAGRGTNASDHISEISKRMKQFCMEMNVGGVVVLQPKTVQKDMMVSTEDNDGSRATGKDVDASLALHRFALGTKKLSQMERMGNSDQNANLSPIVHLSADLSRFGPGGMRKLYLQGEMSYFRELTPTDLVPDVDRNVDPDAPKFGDIAGEGL